MGDGIMATIRLSADKLEEVCGFEYRSGYDFPGVCILHRVNAGQLAGQYVVKLGGFRWTNPEHGGYQERAILLGNLSAERLEAIQERIEAKDPIGTKEACLDGGRDNLDERGWTYISIVA
jgi:hypothetical protein